MNNELSFNSEEIELVEVIGEILKSRTQSIKVLIIKKDGEKFVSFQKWWRKDAEKDAWKEGKGFYLKLEECEKIKEYLEIALNTL